MKKISFLLAAFIVSTIIVNAQFEKGSIMLGVSSTINLLGSSGAGTGIMSIGASNVTATFEYLDFSETYESKHRNLNFQPRAGYFFLDNMAAGAGITFARASRTEEGDGEYKLTQTIMAFEPFYRYYLPLDKITPFMEARVALGSRKDKTEIDGDEASDYKHSLYSFGAGIGASFPIGMNASFDIMAGYNQVNTKWEGTDESESSKIGTLGIDFGFKIFFGGYGFGSADASY